MDSALRPVAATIGIVGLLLLAGATPASAALRAKATVQTAGSGVRLQAVLTNSTAFGERRRPRGVDVVRAPKTYRLSRVSGGGARARTATYRSRVYSGADAARVRALIGKTVSVKVRSKAGTTTLRTKVAKAPATTSPPPPQPPPPAPPPPPAGPFVAPAQQLTGDAALQSFGRYFLNSEFSDCAAGNWPACSVENRYEHGADGSFQYRRCTPTVGADINFVSTYRIVGAQHNADSSWVVEYVDRADTTGDGFYHWEVAANGTVRGYYQYQGGAPELLGPLVWRQPANLGSCIP